MHQPKKEVKILCTVGPACSDERILRRMLDAGMNGIRINTAHGDMAFFKRSADLARRLDIPSVLDIKGPDLRVHTHRWNQVKKGERIKIGFDSSHDIWLSFNISSNLRKGDLLYIKDGKYRFRIIRIASDYLMAKALQACEVDNNQNANVPGKRLSLPGLTKKDLKSISFARRQGIEYIALSFCRGRNDVENLRKLLGRSGIKIISKIESMEGIENVHEIIEASDGIMVARGDLGVELRPEQVPLAQKKIIQACNERGKIVIVATQMLDSMIESPIPTRAEVSDVANAILDGADCLMLSAESAIGRYPVEAVEEISRVSKEVQPQVKVSIPQGKSISDSISECAASIAKQLMIPKIVCLSYSGYTAKMIARFRLNIPIVAVTNSEMVKRQLMLFYSISPLLCRKDFKKTGIMDLSRYLVKCKAVRSDEVLLFTGGLYSSRTGTNMILVGKASELIGH